MTDHDPSGAEPSSREAGVHIVRSGDLSDETPQTSGLKRFEAVSARRLGSQDLWMGLIKPFFLGFVIVTIGCHVGLRTRGGTQGVGRATTSAQLLDSKGNPIEGGRVTWASSKPEVAAVDDAGRVLG